VGIGIRHSTREAKKRGIEVNAPGVFDHLRPGQPQFRFNIRSFGPKHPQVAPRVKSCNLISLPNHKIRLKIPATYENIS
jgi:hypothetical protein